MIRQVRSEFSGRIATLTRELLACAQELASREDLDALCERVGAEQALAMGLVDEVCDKGAAIEAATRLGNMVLDKPRHSVRMTKETINAYAGIGAHAVSYMAHDQFGLAAASPESRAAREAALKRRES